ncbi:protein O-glucosyltransferase 2-like [Rhopilema esculentum]|uniref:protein O-glucosyltransferase 2-like n=1 Tax=Rhopilema esculentum TaxID=499914 RepID=UPI0031DA9AE7
MAGTPLNEKMLNCKLRNVVFLLTYLSLALTAKPKVDVKKSLVFGPALEPNIVLPVRYFYIQLVDTKGKNLTSSPGKENLKVEYSSSAGRVRLWPDLLDRNDGSFIVRFRIMNTYNDLKISVKWKDQHIAKSPYQLKAAIYHEQCNCPETNIEKWLEDMKCPKSFPEIERGFANFKSINLKRLRMEGFKRYDSGAVCHYSLIDGRLYRKCPGSITDFKMFVDAFMLSVLRKVKLPDAEFFTNLGDWPLEKNLSDPLPILSWCGSDETADIVWPTYDVTQSILEALGRQTLDMMSVQANTGPKWKKKIAKAFFRGRDSRQERLDLVVMGRKKTDLFDVALSNFFFFPYDEKKYGAKNTVSFFDFFKYKYQINIDGTVAAYRFPYLLIGDSVVFKQDSPYYEHFYKDLKPWEHYIPFKRDLSDLEKQLIWAKSNDKEARKISEAGRTYARNNLMPESIYCYTVLMFQEYAKRQKQNPKYHKDMELVDQPSDADSRCECYKVPKGKDEL